VTGICITANEAKPRKLRRDHNVIQALAWYVQATTCALAMSSKFETVDVNIMSESQIVGLPKISLI